MSLFFLQSSWLEPPKTLLSMWRDQLWGTDQNIQTQAMYYTGNLIVLTHQCTGSQSHQPQQPWAPHQQHQLLHQNYQRKWNHWSKLPMCHWNHLSTSKTSTSLSRKVRWYGNHCEWDDVRVIILHLKKDNHVGFIWSLKNIKSVFGQPQPQQQL